jgi:hypothetical protein
VPFEGQLCPACQRFVPGGAPGIGESRVEKEIHNLVWWELWPLSAFFTRPKGMRTDVSGWRVLLGVAVVAALLGLVGLIVALALHR